MSVVKDRKATFTSHVNVCQKDPRRGLSPPIGNTRRRPLLLDVMYKYYVNGIQRHHLCHQSDEELDKPVAQ